MTSPHSPPRPAPCADQIITDELSREYGWSSGMVVVIHKPVSLHYGSGQVIVTDAAGGEWQIQHGWSYRKSKKFKHSR